MNTLVSYYKEGSIDLVYQFSVKTEEVNVAMAAVYKYFSLIGGRPADIFSICNLAADGVPSNPTLINLCREGKIISVGFDFLD